MEMRLLSKPATAVRQELSGRGGATDPHGRYRGVRVFIPADRVSGRSRGIKFICVYPSVSGRYGQNGEASGLDPEVLHGFSDGELDEGPNFDAPEHGVTQYETCI